ncbi:MAG: class I SAM-dependent methyltransferase [Caldimonas sp.]
MPLGLMAESPAVRSFDYASAAKETVACCLCGGGRFEPLASVDRYGMGLATVGCPGCGLVQTQPRLTPAGFDAFYRDDYRAYYQGVIEPSEGYVRQMKKGARLAATVAFLRQAGALDDASLAVLDVGCSEGTLFEALRAGGFAGPLFGVEPNATFAAYAAGRHGAEIVANEAHMPATWHGRIGLATMIHVLEHVADPVATLAGLRSLLAPGGRIYVDVPDVAAYASLNDLHIAHVYHFNAATLHATLIAAGLQVERLEPHRPDGHPPSLRAVAVACGGAPLAIGSAGEARDGWPQVRKINRARFRLGLKRLRRAVLAPLRSRLPR